MKRKSKNKFISLLLAAVLVFTLAGCGGNEGGGTGSGTNGAGTATEGKGQKENADGAEGQGVMGRYVEEEIALPEEISNMAAANICRREDGSLVVLSHGNTYLTSNDNGATWKVETADWLEDKNAWISSIVMTPDGTIGMDYYTDEQLMQLVLPDGTQVPVEIPNMAEEYIRAVAASDDNRIFAITGAGNLYEARKDGSCELIAATQVHAGFLKIKGNLAFMDSDGREKEGPVIYDMEADAYIEDDTLTEFAQESYGSRYYNGSNDCTMYMMPGEEGALYLIGSKGIHRHAVGGNMMEQVVDGSLSMLSNPSYTITAALQLEEDVFLVLFSNGKILRFTYDANVSAVPENMITIYSLKEDDDMRQIIALYQSQNPDILVSYEVGMEEGGSVTRDDAVKKLNTEIMAGTGPDLIVMDGLPFASYVEKGLLLDITDYLKEYSAQTPLFDNVTDALKADGKAYVAPATINLPKLLGKKEVLDKITDLSDVGEAVEALRKEHPGDDIIAICTEEGVMNRFKPVSAPDWVSADGAVNRENIKEFLEQSKRIYDAQMDGIRTEIVSHYMDLNERYLRDFNQSMDSMEGTIMSDVFDYVVDDAYLLSGWLDNPYPYEICTSVKRREGYEDSEMKPMQNRSGNVFKPQTMLGISTASNQSGAAKEFMGFFLSTPVQQNCYGFPLNQEAYDKQFTPKEGYVGENGEHGGLYLSSDDGKDLEFEIFWPSDAQIAELKAELASADTPYLQDEVLENAVFTPGSAYIRGELSLETALDEIEKQIAIYMAE